MLTTFYTYRALAGEWNALMSGSTISRAYSGSKNEIVIDISDGASIVFGTRGSFRYLFRTEKSGRPRRNVATLLRGAEGMRIVGVEVADRDRILRLVSTGNTEVTFKLYGAQPNVMEVTDGIIKDAFKAGSSVVGGRVPSGRSVGDASDSAALIRISEGDSLSNRKVLARAFPLFDRSLVVESVFRSGLNSEEPFSATNAERLFESAMSVVTELEKVSGPRIYWRGDESVVFSLIRLASRHGDREELFESVDSAVSGFCRRRLGQIRLSEHRGPLLKAVEAGVRRAERSAAELESHLARPSRADRYERWGHLLMASGRGAETGKDSITLEDIFADSEPVVIPLDGRRSVIENAQAYYERARRARVSREAASVRLEQTREHVRQLEADLANLQIVASVQELDQFLADRQGSLSALAGWPDSEEKHSGPRFRRFRLEGAYEVYVGRSARENDELTFSHARKFDIWMHARGVPGSHAVLRLPSRDAAPSRRTLAVAASIAAYFSKGRTSDLVPVTYTARKYVRKPRGAEPGKVIVERENVIMVPPGLPGKPR